MVIWSLPPAASMVIDCGLSKITLSKLPTSDSGMSLTISILPSFGALRSRISFRSFEDPEPGGLVRSNTSLVTAFDPVRSMSTGSIPAKEITAPSRSRVPESGPRGR